MIDSTGDFEAQTGPLRPELLAHCYRMLGSAGDAEDQVQETYLRAWRAFHRFEGRSSIRTWMYSIATNTCLTALASATRRPLPTGLGAPPGDPTVAVVADPGTSWLEPLPDAMLWAGSQPADPAESAVTHEGVGLAVVAALQDLPPRQRATLILREVLRFSAAETAEILETSVAAANSALQRARESVGGGLPHGGRRAADLDGHERTVWQEFCEAFERYDVAAAVSVLATDARWEMPPFDRWYAGRSDIAALVSTQCPASRPRDLRMIPTVVNGQPAAGMYLTDESGVAEPFQLVVLHLRAGAIEHVVGFFDDVDLWFARAGLPARLHD